MPTFTLILSIKLVLCGALILILRLGSEMARGQAGRGNLAELRGLTIIRSILVPLMVLSVVWWIVVDNTIPSIMTFASSNEERLFGLGLCTIGFSLRTWSQWVLSKYWSADLSVRADHVIIQNGPYWLNRHPIYASYWPLSIGLLIATGNFLIGGLGMMYAVISLLRITAEEKLLVDHFGDGYGSYRKDTNDRMAAVACIIIILIQIPGMLWEVVVCS